MDSKIYLVCRQMSRVSWGGFQDEEISVAAYFDHNLAKEHAAMANRLLATADPQRFLKFDPGADLAAWSRNHSSGSDTVVSYCVKATEVRTKLPL